MLEGHDPNAMFRVMKVLRIMLLRSNLFLLSLDPDPPNLGGHKSPEGYAGLGYFQEVDPIEPSGYI